jgi:hypothetical protein
MTPEAQRIAIAKACGWKNLQEEQYYWMGTPPDGSDLRVTYKRHTLLDYLNDLNAMHEAEKVLPDLYAYQLELIRVCEKADGRSAWRATAAQRAEAFLRTLGLWTDTKGA